ncbi:MAG: VOC family protein [Planctomycetota bacterium]|nr:VOC family protein [Planctomycetaceae bacterium]MDQ3332358.1 VOC family protein [Planctomycetota bacterium]
MIRGLRTVIYRVSDLAAAKAWCARAVEREPYFDQPFYVGFNVGGFELGLVPDGAAGPGGSVAYWGVPDAAAELSRLESLGATVREPLQDVGEGIKVAVVADPFGNSFGIIENPHFDAGKVE